MESIPPNPIEPALKILKQNTCFWATLPALQEALLVVSSDLPADFALKSGGGILGEISVSISHETKHRRGRIICGRSALSDYE